MNHSIAFPHLGIELANVGQSFYIGSLEVAYYGCCIGIGILMGYFLATQIAKRSGQNEEIYLDLIIYGVITSIAGARLYYVAFEWEHYKDNLLSILNLREGGLAIYGGVLAAVLTAFIYTRIKKTSLPTILDTIGPGFAIGQVIGRWGNFFNREAFGDYTDGLFAMRLPVSAVRASDITENIAAHIQTIDGIEFIQVHPTFLYEGLWNACLLIILLLAWKKRKFEGQIFCMYLAGYGLGRFWIEGLRTDSLMLSFAPIRVSQALALLMLIGAGGYLIYRLCKVNKTLK